MIQRPQTLYGYTCPDCDTYNKKVEGMIRDGIVTVRCAVCGFVERFEKGACA